MQYENIQFKCKKVEKLWKIKNKNRKIKKETAFISRFKHEVEKNENLRLPWLVVVVPFKGRKEVNSTGTRTGETGLSVLVLLLVHSGEVERHRLDKSATRAFF